MGYDFGVGREAPTFTLSAVDGSEIRLNQYRGDWFPVLVFVPIQRPAPQRCWSSSARPRTPCGDCAASWSASATPAATMVKALADGVSGMAFPLLPDDGSVALQYGALRKDRTVRPMAFIIDRAGKIVWTGEGEAALKAPKLIAAFRDVVR